MIAAHFIDFNPVMREYCTSILALCHPSCTREQRIISIYFLDSKLLHFNFQFKRLFVQLIAKLWTLTFQHKLKILMLKLSHVDNMLILDGYFLVMSHIFMLAFLFKLKQTLFQMYFFLVNWWIKKQHSPARMWSELWATFSLLQNESAFFSHFFRNTKHSQLFS